MMFNVQFGAGHTFELWTNAHDGKSVRQQFTGEAYDSFDNRPGFEIRTQAGRTNRPDPDGQGRDFVTTVTIVTDDKNPDDDTEVERFALTWPRVRYTPGAPAADTYEQIGGLQALRYQE